MKTRIVMTKAETGRLMYWPQYRKFFMWFNFRGRNGGRVYLLQRKEARNWIRNKATVIDGNIHTVLAS